jgi:hypothetical protein
MSSKPRRQKLLCYIDSCHIVDISVADNEEDDDDFDETKEGEKSKYFCSAIL